MAGERTEKPTSKRLRDARRKGQLARSRDVEAAAQLVAALVALGWLGPWIMRGLGHVVRVAFERMGERAHTALEPGDVATLAVHGSLMVVAFAGPVAVAAAAATVAAAAAQGGWNVAPEALVPKWDKLSPVNGLKRLAPGRAGVNLLKTTLGVTLVAWIAWRIVSGVVDGSPYFSRLDPVRAAGQAWGHAEQLLRQSAIAIGALAALDYGIQRWQLMKTLKMTRQEVKDELRMQEGSPEVRARVRRLQRDMVRRRMMAAVPKATVVVTNPTHYAVALAYQRGAMAAPVVVAKGKNLVAQRIREIAREHGVPIVENKPLAQALYKTVDIDQAIPGDLFGAVAEVLAYLIRLKQIVL
jgi:flagellar biosynthetic protein FlhB